MSRRSRKSRRGSLRYCIVQVEIDGIRHHWFLGPTLIAPLVPVADLAGQLLLHKAQHMVDNSRPKKVFGKDSTYDQGFDSHNAVIHAGPCGA